MDEPALRFGVEIELLLGSNKKTHTTWKSLARDLSKRLKKAGIGNHINENNDKSPTSYFEWSIAQEVTIPSQPAKNLFLYWTSFGSCFNNRTVGLELVSPVYPIYSYWATDLETIFSVLHTSFTLVSSPNCSTHVHISGAPALFNSLELAALSTSILYYESALDSLFPPFRTSSTYWCQSNRSNPALSLASLANCMASLDNVAATSTSLRPIVELMNLFPAASAYGRAHGKKRDFVRGKVYKWDLTGTLVPDRGDVEFRQAPGSLSAVESARWVTLALAFVAGAVGRHGLELCSEAVLSEEGASTLELRELLIAGATAVGWEGLGDLEDLLDTAESSG